MEECRLRACSTVRPLMCDLLQHLHPPCNLNHGSSLESSARTRRACFWRLLRHMLPQPQEPVLSPTVGGGPETHPSPWATQVSNSARSPPRWPGRMLARAAESRLLVPFFVCNSFSCSTVRRNSSALALLHAAPASFLATADATTCIRPETRNGACSLCFPVCLPINGLGPRSRINHSAADRLNPARQPQRHRGSPALAARFPVLAFYHISIGKPEG
jgi:hypothetical protein